ncbi:carbohydrate-binding module family 1 protein [Sphaerobolus stellatus SS14]|uniref:Carboxylic ester hydrolase n=1 Tax=Sphaerobolus stellatus (strain SS14) TaxID=990650 RepID=A0A0C9W4S6_SPHS4|nr:carbohydrate-binding module family 1 protein [Sphaerobolus stellatus SS14]
MVLLFTSFLSLLTTVYGLTSSLQQVNNWSTASTNPTGVGMYLYKPTTVITPTPILVAAHYCGGTAQAYFSGTQYAAFADTYGYLVIYPNAPAVGSCWDVNTNATLSHNGGGDSLGIVSMVRYAVSNLGGDVNRAYITGTSSGAMMTNVLIGAYPDVFKGGSAFSGVPFGCFAGPYAWNTQCAMGELIMTPQQWGDLVRNAYPGYTGPRPKMQVWHGTADTTLYPQNFQEEVKQWTNVLNYSLTAQETNTNDPLPGYTRSIYGPSFQAILAQGVGHTVPEQANDVLTYFGLNAASPAPTTISTTIGPTGPTSTIFVPPATTVPPPTGVPTAAHWAQCGGIGFTGPTVCASPYTCQVSNAYWSQCL